jgi:ABC-type histidine transport system ATPase subunit
VAPVKDKVVKREEVVSDASELFNAMSQAHNAIVARFQSRGFSSERAAVASYVALRVMLDRFDGPVTEALSASGTELVEGVIKIMCEMQAGKRSPVARFPIQEKAKC